jgi:hypothetical protein
MDRRRFLTGLLAGGAAGALAGPLAQGAAAQSSAGAVDVVERFGFVADGRTDNADAFLRWADHVNREGGGDYLFPPGRYFVRRFREAGGAARGREHPTIRGCDGLTIRGTGARIELNGAFHRSERKGPNGRAVGADVGTFVPFLLRSCRNVRISGFEIDGGVRAMTRDRSVAEAYAYLLVLRGCTSVVLEDLYLHHSQTDAILLYEDGHESGGPGRACRNITLNRVRCLNNARGAFAPLQVNGLLCTDSQFDGSNAGLGRYLEHSPGFGVDIEPDYFRPNEVDVRTGNLEFRRCRFEGNASAFLAAYPHHYTGYLRLIDCTSSNPGNNPNHIIICWPGAIIQGGRHDAGEGTIYTSWQDGRGGDLTIRDCEIRSSGPYGILHDHPSNLLRMENVKLTGAHRSAGTHGFLLTVRGDPGGGRRNLVRGCEIFLPRARKSRELPYDYEVSFHNTVSEGNVFRTDLPAAGGQHFCTEYGPRSEARGDRYVGTAPGPSDSFRPAHSADFDTRQPYSRR